MARQSAKAKLPAGRRKQKFMVTLDPGTVKVLERIVANHPEIEGKSGAIRYLAHHHKTASSVKDVTP